MIRRRKIRKAHKIEITPDEIFLDSENIPEFNTQQFEGRLERPIEKKSATGLGIFTLVMLVIFGGQLVFLQIENGSLYFEKSKNNSLDKEPIFSDRGIIYDRNNVELAWNTESKSIDGAPFLERTYTLTPGFSHILGYVSYPSKDKSGRFWQTEFIGKNGVEKVYNQRLSGENGMKLIEKDALGNIISENLVNQPKEGENLLLSIDSRIQSKMYTAISDLAGVAGFKGGGGVMIDITNGEVLALTSFPEYDSNIISKGDDKQKINEYLSDAKKPLINRVVTGLYTPGSIVKPFVSMGVLAEKLITPSKQILSTGSISIPNPYFPDKPTVFKDNKAHGWVDMKRAIAVSSNVYFYAVGGGYRDQAGLGILNIKKYSQMFGIGAKTNIDLPSEVDGNIPDPDWKKKNFRGEQWRIGDTYNTSIGQYGYQVTPIQMARAVGAIASNGTLVTPHVLKDDPNFTDKKVSVALDPGDFAVVKEGMRLGVLEGTGGRLNFPFVKVATKTGTAQVGIAKNRINSWVIGFFPYENPKYAFAILMESAPSSNQNGATYVMAEVLRHMELVSPEYFNQ